ncbi:MULTISPECIES: glycerol-3-phosphate acyltransferase [unclassified Gemella]|uniref:glycerol-3-phosphate acyltransferase n=1 Tax=unclassified Gemella TaxID=2624949 RepID=UPI0010748011|nr:MULTISPECIES: glycerol-3-phosphate acyltransferase [unclassified Gemella]MBF0710800.1 glycerol-3-phosphate acyltransferase [Gemella sp. GL1.1]MBF0746630.1 glycerol-3-phosphate acyltransferase [Gemella sp. 19428wG2_WT2a]NYS28144.1 glycerol-3-phosphate acyltransferase [Gemella sp. GL1]TFU59982.1 hypothetical protein E4T67_03075 [Gemella sp. WT2a]
MILNILYVVFAYLMGNIMGGKILQLIYGVDISKRGSGNVGARNAGKLLGQKAFVLVATVDLFKGFLVVIFLKFAGVNNWVMGLSILLVILGHIRPIFFDGGKGVATFIGAILALSPNVFFVFLLGLLMISFVTRSLTIGFYMSLPVLIVIYYLDFKDVLGTFFFMLTIVLLIFVAYESITKSFNRYFAVKKRRIVRRVEKVSRENR